MTYQRHKSLSKCNWDSAQILGQVFSGTGVTIMVILAEMTKFYHWK